MDFTFIKTIKNVMMITSVMILLGACSSHANPLKTTNSDEAAKFLVSASQAAEKQLHVFNAPGGYYYGQCMMGKMKKDFCGQLYQAMVNYAKTTSSFQTLTVSDLTDPAMFNSIKENYERVRFNTI